MDINRIQAYYTSNLSSDQMAHLIEKFPKVFCKLIREFQSGKFAKKQLQISEDTEFIEVSLVGNKLHIEVITQARNFSENFKTIVEDLTENIKNNSDRMKHSLLECGFRKSVIEQVNQSVENWDIEKTDYG